MRAVPSLLSRLTSSPLAICPRRGGAALRVLGEWDWEPGGEIPIPEEPAPGIVPVHGVLVHRGLGFGPELDAWCGLVEYGELIKQVRAAEADPKVSAIVIDFDSPGGEIAGLFDAADALAAIGKPMIAVANECACSAAYVLAAACKRIVATRTAYLGSVGVVTHHEDLSGALAQDGVRVSWIYAGDKKVDGNSAEPLSPRARADIQAEVDEAYRLMVETVARYRRMKPDAVRATQAGVYSGEAAIKVGFADETGTLEGVLATATATKARAGSSRQRFGSRPQFTRRSA